MTSSSAIFNKTCSACFSRCASRGATSFVLTVCEPVCATRLRAANQTANTAIQFTFCTNQPSCKAGNFPRCSVRHLSCYNLKLTLRQEVILQNTLSIGAEQTER